MRRLAGIAALVLAGSAAAAGPPVTVLPRPRFNAPAGTPKKPSVRFVVASSTAAKPARTIHLPHQRKLLIEGPDGATRHLVVAPGKFAFDFRRYAVPPRIAAGDRDLVYEQVVWAKEEGGVLYVETAHSTYARSSGGLNGYLNAVDIAGRKLLWRSPALVANARTFVVLPHVVVTGYGFTAEPDYLYALSRQNGHVVSRLPLPSAPDRIAKKGAELAVDTYDHRLLVRVVGG